MAISLTTQAVNSGIVNSALDVFGANEKFVFNTVGDDRVCPICEPLDGVVMSEQDGDLEEPPLHDNCRCFLIPLF